MAFYAAPFNVSAQEVLYGMTQFGGVNDKGVPYQVRLDGSHYLSFRDFNGVDGEKPGNGARFTQISDQAFIGSGFTIKGFAALTEYGYGDQKIGNRFDIKVNQNGLIAPFRFALSATSSGINPTGGFYTSPGGTLYATTSQKGQFGGGALFSAPPAYGNGITVLGSFDGLNTGRSPKGTPIMGANGKLYGTTEFGGSHDLGVIFCFNDFGNNPGLKKIFDFDGEATGANPTGNMVFASNRKLYGMTSKGGTSDRGVIFSIEPNGSGYRKLVDFDGRVMGGNPMGSLVQFADQLYGMTSTGGAYGYGSIFSIDINGSFNKLHDFNGEDGKTPLGDLLVDTSGKNLFGVTYAGGSNDDGVLFTLVNGTQFKKLRDFKKETGSHPVGTLLMERLEPTLSVQNAKQAIANNEPFSLLVKTNTSMPVYMVSADTTIIDIKDNKLYPRSAGNVEIRIFLLGNHSHMPTLKTIRIVVEKNPQTINFQPIPAKVFGDKSFNISVTASSGLPVEVRSSTPDIASVAGNVVTIYKAGLVDLIAIQPGDARYAQAPYVIQPLEIARASQQVNFAPLNDLFCCNEFNLVATSTSGLPVAFRVSDRSKLSIYETRATPTGTGSVEVIAFQSGTVNYNSSETRQTLEIAKGYQSITFSPNKTEYTLGDPPSYVSVYSKVQPVVITSNPPGIAEFENGVLNFLAVGTTTLTATQAGNELFNPAFPVSRTITVKPPLTPRTDNTITWAGPASSKSLADPPFNLIASATSGLPVSYSSSNPAALVIKGNQATVLGSGEVMITASQAGNDSVPAAVSISRTIKISKTEQYIGLYLDSRLYYSEGPFELAIKTSSGLPITYSISRTDIASIENFYLVPKGYGTLTITASNPGNETYLPVSISRTVQIYPPSDQVYFSQIPVLKFGDAPVALKAYSVKEYPIKFNSSNPNVASVSGSTLTIKAAGRVTVSASSGPANFEVQRTSQTWLIAKADQTISFDSIPQMKYGDSPFSLNVSSSSKLPVSLSTTTPAVVSISGTVVTIIGNGMAEITAAQPGDDNYNPAENVSKKFEIKEIATEFDLVGTTSVGGPNGSGVIYSMNTSGTDFSYLKLFDPQTSPSPNSGFIKGLDGNIYGGLRGSSNDGRIVRLNPDGTNLVSIHSFTGDDGSSPAGNLVQTMDGFLYGTTNKGGDTNGGTIFRIRPDGTDFKVIYYLNSLSGRSVQGGLTLASDGKLYGVTAYGGFFGYGTIFVIDTNGNDFSIVFHFDYQTGYNPTGELVEGPDGQLYGTNSTGSDKKMGCLYKIKTDGTSYTKLINFDNVTLGAAPMGGITFDENGRLYGVTVGGGTSNLGTIYTVDVDGTNAKRLFNFDESSGTYPYCKLLIGSDGNLYGGTFLGGANESGTIFSISRDGSGFRKLADLDEHARSFQYGPLLEMTPGNFFGGTAFGGSFNSGALFKVTNSNEFFILESFPQSDQTPRELVVDPSGKYYYGVTSAVSWNQGGGIYRLTSDGKDYKQIYKVPVGETVETIFYCSTGHLWISGERYNPISGELPTHYLIRFNTDGTDVEEITGYAAGTGDINTVSALVEGNDGTIYGFARGLRRGGFLFKIRNDGTGFSILQQYSTSFFFYGNILSASDGNFYCGIGETGIFRFTPNGVVTQVFSYPSSVVSQVPYKIIELNGGRIGVVTQSNEGQLTKKGSNGSVFSIEKDGTGYSPIFFPLPGDGGGPLDMIQSMDGSLYVSSKTGGQYGKGVIYKVRPDGSNYTRIREFNGADGAKPITLIFKKQQQFLSFELLDERTVFSSPFVPPATSSSGAPILFTSSNPQVAKVENGRIVPLMNGSTTITAKLSANSNYYDGGSIERILIVNKAPQKITFEMIPEKRIFDDSFDLTAFTTSGLPVSFSSSDPAIASINGSRVEIHNAGTIQIVATQEGSDDYLAAEPVTVNLVVRGRDKQSITVDNPLSKTVGDAPFELIAASSAGLPLTFVSSSSAIGIEGVTISILDAGTVEIIASQEGNVEFDAATPVVITFCVNPRKPVISESGIYPDQILHSSNSDSNKWFRNGEPVFNGDGPDLYPAGEGTYTVRTTVDNCTSETSEPFVLITTGTDLSERMQFSLFPNPVTDVLTVTNGSISDGSIEVIDLLGNRVITAYIRGNEELPLDLASLPSGVYIVKFITGNKTILQKVFKK